MTLSSLEYCLFLPFVFLGFWLLFSKNLKTQNAFLVAINFLFYGIWDWRSLLLLCITIITTFSSASQIVKSSNKQKRKLWLLSAIIINIGILFFYKYFNFFITSFTEATSLIGVNLQANTLKIVLPVGISFYTFTALSYPIDVYHKKNATNDILAYTAYVSFFPTILSGPIGKSKDILSQFLTRRSFDYNQAVQACKYILLGGVLKLCLADRIGSYVDNIYGNYEAYNGTTLLLCSILYSIQIYADFAGYSLIAIGSGKLFGIDLQQNFCRPYFARTITDFWRRWHISLTTWFRDYIYFPLGGNRCHKARWILNTMIVFLISGLWHGANYTFLIWGALHGICMVIERIAYGDKIKNVSQEHFNIHNIIRILMTFIIVNFAWIFFRLDSLNDVINVFYKIFTDYGGVKLDINLFSYFLPALFVTCASDIYQECHNGAFLMMDNNRRTIRWIGYVLLGLLIILFGSFEQSNFIYFQF